MGNDMSTETVDIEKALEPIRNWPYQNDKVVVLTYSEKHTAVFPEDFLAKVYFHFKNDGLIDTIFPGMDVNHLNRFISFVSRCPGLLIPCIKTETKPIPIGIGFLTEVGGDEGARRASFGFGYFKEFHKDRRHIAASACLLGWWMMEAKVDMLWGTSLNPVAIAYSKRFGFKPVATLPKFFSHRGTLRDASLIYLEKEVFSPLWEAFKSERG
jgi:hypothetical protein